MVDPLEYGYRDPTALFFSMWQRLPVYHAFPHDGRGRGKDDDGYWRSRTRCGLVAYQRNEDGWREFVTYVPMKHAVRFGRPCLHCFPDVPRSETGAGVS